MQDLQEEDEMSDHHHDDNSMPSLDIRWKLVPSGSPLFPGYWVRDEHYEALKKLGEAGMLPVVTEEELPN